MHTLMVQRKPAYSLPWINVLLAGI